MSCQPCEKELSLPDQGFEHIRSLKEFGVLGDSNHTRRLNLQAGTIKIVCPDGDQFSDLFRHQTSLVPSGRIHPISINGGALRLPRHSPLNDKVCHHRVILLNIAEAVQLKGFVTIKLYSHFPCGAARLAKLGVPECLDLLMQSRTIVRRAFPNLAAVCMFHVAYDHDSAPEAENPKGKRTYLVSLEKYAEWRKFRQPPGDLVKAASLTG